MIDKNWWIQGGSNQVFIYMYMYMAFKLYLAFFYLWEIKLAVKGVKKNMNELKFFQRV